MCTDLQGDQHEMKALSEEEDHSFITGPSTVVLRDDERQIPSKPCLHEAVANRRFSAVFSSKEDVNHVNPNLETALHYAAELGASGIALLLLERKANLNATDLDGFTPLILSANFGHLEVVEILLDGGAAINYVDIDGRTALHYAAFVGNKSIVSCLLKRGANPSIGSCGDLPYDLAEAAGHWEVARILREESDKYFQGRKLL